MLQRLVAAGISELYIDRFGYEDIGTELELNIQQYIDTAPIVSADQRFVFYDIRSYADQYRFVLGEDQWELLTIAALKMDPKIFPSRAVHSLEMD